MGYSVHHMQYILPVLIAMLLSGCALDERTSRAAPPSYQPIYYAGNTDGYRPAYPQVAYAPSTYAAPVYSRPVYRQPVYQPQPVPPYKQPVWQAPAKPVAAFDQHYGSLTPPAPMPPVIQPRLPAPTVADPAYKTHVDHTIQSGDSLYGIARTYQSDIPAIASANTLQPPYVLRAGQVLKIPTNLAVPNSQQPAAASLKPFSDTGGKLAWPVAGRVLSHYGLKRDGQRNQGINIAAPLGVPVYASSDGKVIYTGQKMKSYGNIVMLKHDNDLITTYAHLGEIRVRKGDAVRRNQQIASTGLTGSIAAPQVHFEVRRDQRAINPLPLLGQLPLPQVASK